MKITVQAFQKLSKVSNSFYDEIKVEFLYHSNKLEGSTFNRDNIIELMEYKKVLGEHFLDDVIETKNSLELFDKVIDTLKEPFDKFLLWDWHRTLKKGSVDEEIGNTGRWKKYSNTLLNTDIKLCEPNLVDNAIYNLIEDYKQSKKNIETIADFHQKFEHIHPFQDGNGRIGRFIILRQCIENNIDLIAIDNEYNKEYKDALYVAQTKGDNSELVEVFKKCQKRLDNKLEKYKQTIETINNEEYRKIESNETMENDLSLEELQALLDERNTDDEYEQNDLEEDIDI